MLVDRYAPVAYAVACAQTRCREDAEDIVQESFLKAYRSLDSLREGAKFGFWLARIVRNTSATLLAAGKRSAEVQAAQAPLAEETATPDVERQEIRKLLRRRIEQMPCKEREILLLHYFAGRTTREAAHILGITRHAAKKRLERARQALGQKVLAELEPALELAHPSDERAGTLVAMCLASPIAWKSAAGGSTAAVAGSAAAAATSAAATGQVLAINWVAIAILACILFVGFYGLFCAVPRFLRHTTGRPVYGYAWVVAVVLMLSAGVGAAAWEFTHVPARLIITKSIDSASQPGSLTLTALRIVPPQSNGDVRKNIIEVDVANTLDKEQFLGLEYDARGGKLLGGFLVIGSSCGSEIQAVAANSKSTLTFTLDVPHRFVYEGSIRVKLAQCLGTQCRDWKGFFLPDNFDLLFSEKLEVIPGK